MAKEIKGAGKDLLFGSKKIIFLPLIGKEKIIELTNVKCIEYSFAENQQIGTLSTLSRTHEKDSINFKKSQNENVLAFLDMVKENCEHIALKDITEFIAQAKIATQISADNLEALKIQKSQLDVQNKQLNLQSKQFDAMAKCPRCGSTTISGNKKGYGVVKGGIGALALGAAGPFGAIIGAGAGNIGRKKVLCTCMKCGHKFKAGKAR